MDYQTTSSSSQYAFSVQASASIDVYVMNQAQYDGFSSSQTVSQPYFEFRGSAVNNITAVGGPDTYYLVMYNDVSNTNTQITFFTSLLPGLSLSPYQIRSAYDVDPLMQLGYTGKGVTVAVVNTGIDSSFYADLQSFDQFFGLPNANISVVTPDGTAGTNQETPQGETTGDVEFVHAMAPDAHILLVLMGTSTFYSELDGFSYVIDNHAADIAVVSPSVWYSPGSGDMAAVEAFNNEYSKSVGEGITLIAASNDFGSNNTSTFAGTVPGAGSYLMPQFSPYVTAVGGTNLYVNATGGYLSETGWNQSSGGPSYVFPQPSWQVGSGVPANGARDDPDIALDASCSTPYIFYWDGGLDYFCGTSGAAPTFAGMVADLDQAAGHSLGFLNPSLYSLAASAPSVYHDVTSGCSLVTEDGVTTNGYCAHPGWDFVTGWGSPDLAQLMYNLVGNVALTQPHSAPQSGGVDVGQTVSFSTTLYGKQGTYAYSWTGLPGCPSVDAPTMQCTASQSGTFSVSVTATGSEGQTATSPPLTFNVDTDPTVSQITVSPTPLPSGTQATFQVSVSGGRTPYSYDWIGLPEGCVGTSSPAISCLVQATGNYSIGVDVTDSNGFEVSSGLLSLGVVKAATSTSISCSPATDAVGTSTVCTATVAGNNPAGMVSWSSSGSGSFSPSQDCTLSAGTCSVSYVPSSYAISSVTITGSYGGDQNNAESSGTFALTIIPATATTTTSAASTSTTPSVTSSTRFTGSASTPSTSVVLTSSAPPSSTTASSTGEIPEFPSAIFAATAVAVGVVAAYALARRGTNKK